jgi:phage terminase small subunit
MTPKQIAFVAEYLIDMNATQAAIRAGYSAHTAVKIGSENLRKPEVRKAIDAARAKVMDAAEMTVEKHMHDLKRLRDGAESDGKWAAAVAAEVARGKVSGFYVEKVEVDAKVRGTVSYKANIPARKS